MWPVLGPNTAGPAAGATDVVSLGRMAVTVAAALRLIFVMSVQAGERGEIRSVSDGYVVLWMEIRWLFNAPVYVTMRRFFRKIQA